MTYRELVRQLIKNLVPDVGIEQHDQPSVYTHTQITVCHTQIQISQKYVLGDTVCQVKRDRYHFPYNF